MTQAKGSNAELSMLEEVVFGTTPAVTPGDATVIPFASESLKAARAKEDNPHMTGTRNYGLPVNGRADCGGDISFRMNPLAHGFLLKSVLGDPVTTGVGPFVHTFKVPAVLPTYSIDKLFDDVTQSFHYTGMTGSKLAASVKDSGYSECTLSYIGKGRTADATPMDSAPTSLVDNPFDMAAADIAITEGGSTLATATELTFEIDNELDGDQYTIANQGQRGGVPCGKAKASGTLVAFFEDLTLFNKAVNSTESAIVFTYRHGDGTGTAGNEKLEVTLPEIIYDEDDPVVDGSGGINQTLPFRAVFSDNADASSYKFVLTNQVASYA